MNHGKNTTDFFSNFYGENCKDKFHVSDAI